MENNNYGHYIFSNLNKITMVLAIFSFIGIEIFIDGWELRIAVLIFFLFILLLMTSIHIFKDKNRIFEGYKEIKRLNDSSKEEKRKIQEKFENQSIKYNESIEEKNAYKEVVHLVDAIVHSTNYKTREANQLTQTLKYSIDKHIKGIDEK